MTTKERLHTLIDRLDDAEANELLEYAGWLSQESDTLTDDELARARAGQGGDRARGLRKARNASAGD